MFLIWLKEKMNQKFQQKRYANVNVNLIEKKM